MPAGTLREQFEQLESSLGEYTIPSDDVINLLGSAVVGLSLAEVVDAIDRLAASVDLLTDATQPGP